MNVCECWAVLKQLHTYRHFTPDNKPVKHLPLHGSFTHCTSTRKVVEPRREKQYATIICWNWCFKERLFWVNLAGDTNQRRNRALCSCLRLAQSLQAYRACHLLSIRFTVFTAVKIWGGSSSSRLVHVPSSLSRQPQSVNIASVLFTVGCFQHPVIAINKWKYNYSCFKNKVCIKLQSW